MQVMVSMSLSDHVIPILMISTAAVSNTILSRREPMLITTSGQRRDPSDLVGLNDSSSDSGSSSSESSSDSDGSESDEEHEGGGRQGQEAQAETPASGITSNVAVEDPWRGPAFDNVLSFWQIV
jgi:hypothetical protein